MEREEEGNGGTGRGQPPPQYFGLEPPLGRTDVTETLISRSGRASINRTIVDGFP